MKYDSITLFGGTEDAWQDITAQAGSALGDDAWRWALRMLCRMGVPHGDAGLSMLCHATIYAPHEARYRI